MAEEIDYIEWEKGQTLFERGSEPSGLFIMLEGSVFKYKSKD